jgi:hypothetical protein
LCQISIGSPFLQCTMCVPVACVACPVGGTGSSADSPLNVATRGLTCVGELGTDLGSVTDQ